MTIEAIPTFPRSHDPDDLAVRNIDLSGFLRRLGNPNVDTVDVFLDPGCSDTTLIFSAKSYDAAAKRVSYRQTGGTRTATHVDPNDLLVKPGYLVTCRVNIVGGLHYDQSVIQLIRHH